MKSACVLVLAVEIFSDAFYLSGSLEYARQQEVYIGMKNGDNRRIGLERNFAGSLAKRKSPQSTAITTTGRDST
jgi:hypothetical protein